MRKIDSQKNIVKKFPKSFRNVELREWSLENLTEASKYSDLAIIPIIEEDKFACTKPENKLLSFWCLNIPTIFSPIPSYRRLAVRTGTQANMVQSLDWYEKLNSTYENRRENRNYLEIQRGYIDKFHSRESLIAKWDEVFDSI